ncbi:MAG: peptidylprolyl isomerase [Armatimonadetes bacterium]|nr:peptidylprolyl isomerase [Armatimonadota bacterium]
MKSTTGLASMLGIVLALSPLAGGALQTQPKQEPKQQPQKQQQPKQEPKQQPQKQQQPKQGQQQQKQTQQRQQQRQQTQQRQGQQAQRPQTPQQYRPKPLPAGDTVVATVNGEPIRASELIQASYEWFAATAIEELILERVIEQEARAQRVTVSNAEVEARYKQQLQNAESQVPPGMSLDDFLKRNQFPPSRLFARIRSQLLVEKLVERQVNLDDFVEYSQLVIRIQGNTPEQQEENTPAAEAKAQEAYQKIKEGLDFAEAVKEYSEDPFSKDRGGKMNWQNLNFIVPDLRQKLQAMQPGEISEPFKMMGSIVIIRKERTGSQASPEEQQELREQAVRLQIGEYVRQLQAKAKITNTIVQPFDPTTAAPPGGPNAPRPPAARPVPR